MGVQGRGVEQDRGLPRGLLEGLGRVEMVAELTDLIKEDEDRIMIIDMGPVDGRVAERIEFLGGAFGRKWTGRKGYYRMKLH